MTEKQLSAGDHITSRCSKCKDVTNHTIVAMVEDKVVRVECNVCGSIHNYRSAAPAIKTARKTTTTASTTKTSGGRLTRSSNTETEWAAQLNDASGEPLPYNLKTPYKPGDVIQHTVFGMGRVINTIRPNKMEVYFRDGLKLLRCTLK